ncbi:DnaJ domain-containing protein [Halegenticoccus soli]|uniref:DnaJ domain-containing protein n=1 Tax=Halegenticoccus soli TaxID=1985678 RepID=UPI000C6D9BCC|nr:DnaJ domain-containing protein [Halegenticoccus soli]
MPEDFYDLLGVGRDATADELKAAYRAKAQEYHPDVNDDERAGAQFTIVRRAYDVLRDDAERARYDRLGHRTYVAQHMNGLPSVAARRASSDADGSQSDRTGSRGRWERRPGGSNGSNGSRSNARAGASANAAAGSAAGRGSSPGDGSTGSPDPSPNGGTRTDRGRPNEGTTAGRNRSGARSADRRRVDASASTRTAPAGARGTRTDGRTRRATLRARWVAVALAALAYLVGVGRFALANRAGLDAAAGRLATEPVAALGGGYATVPPTAFARAAVGGAAVGEPSVAILFPAGALALPLVLGVTVLGYGRGTAWLYAVCAFAPAAALTLGAAFPARPLGVDLLLFVALPVGAALVFLGDLGRYLRAAG